MRVFLEIKNCKSCPHFKESAKGGGSFFDEQLLEWESKCFFNSNIGRKLKTDIPHLEVDESCPMWQAEDFFKAIDELAHKVSQLEGMLNQ